MTAAQAGDFQIIDTSADPFYSQVTDLDGINYILSFAYNQRETCWYLSIADIQANDLMTGIKIVSNWKLLRRGSDTGLPPGELVARSYTQDDSPPGLDDFGPGKRVELVYIPVLKLLKGFR